MSHESYLSRQRYFSTTKASILHKKSDEVTNDQNRTITMVSSVSVSSSIVARAKAVASRNNTVRLQVRGTTMSPFWLVSVLVFISILANSAAADPLLRGTQQNQPKQTLKSSSLLNNTDAITKQKSSLPVPAAVWSLPLHAVSGTHHVNLNVGEPVHRRTLIVDTGSRLTAWVCNECHNCGQHANTPYSFLKSSTAVINTCGGCDWPDTSEAACRATQPSHRLRTTAVKAAEALSKTRCGMRQKYTEGSSWTAHEVNDIVILPVHNHRQSPHQQKRQISASINAHNNTQAVTVTAPTLALDDDTVIDAWQEDILETAIPFTFGCQDKVHHMFQKQYADGIMGLEATEKSLVHQLYRAGRLASPIFSLCLTPNAGYIGFGGAVTTTNANTVYSATDDERAVAIEPMKFTPMVSEIGKKKWYAVKVVEFYLIMPHSDYSQHKTNTTNSNERVQVAARDSMESRAFADSKGSILDSGTTDTFLPQDISHAFDPAWFKLTGQTYNNRANKYTHAEFLNLPNFVLVLDNEVTLVIPAAHYMEGLPPNYQRDHADGKPAVAWPETRNLSSRVYVDEPQGAVLGLNAMMGHDILFDATANRIGFAPANCHGLAHAAPTTPGTII